MEKNKNIPRSLLVLMKENKILFLERANTGSHDWEYCLVAGHVEKWESFTDAIIREANEEVGILLDHNKIRTVHIQHKKSNSGNEEGVLVYFLATERKGEIKNMEPQKCNNILRFDMDNIPENIVDCVKSWIQYIKNNIFYSEFGR